MSIYYKADNEETTINLFNKGIVYKMAAIRSQDNNVIDFNWGEKFLYGRVRHDSTPIVLGSESMLKNITSAPSDEVVSAVNFVTDIFEAMALQFQKCATLNKIVSNDPFLSNLVAYQAYIPPQVLYEDYKSIIFNAVEFHFKSNNIYVKNFEEFMHIFRSITYRLAKSIRFTFPGFVKSKDCPILCSGLAIEIAPGQDAADDDSKITNFTQSKNWDFFVNTCDTYGFMIDYNVPWRIVADIDSESMREIALRYGYVNPYDLLSRGYRSAATEYMVMTLQGDMFDLYNLVRSDYWTEPQMCNGSYTGTKAYTSREYIFEDFSRQFGFYYFLDLYLFLRLCEEQPEMSWDHKQYLMNDIVKLVKSDNKTLEPLVMFERIINKEFDKVGSYSYIKKALRLQKEEAFNKGEREAVGMNDNDISNY